MLPRHFALRQPEENTLFPQKMFNSIFPILGNQGGDTLPTAGLKLTESLWEV